MEPIAAGVQEQHSGAFGARFSRAQLADEPITAGVWEQDSGAFGARQVKMKVCTAFRGPHSHWRLGATFWSFLEH
eukprot:3810706-Rhodomonas_salina.1